MDTTLTSLKDIKHKFTLDEFDFLMWMAFRVESIGKDTLTYGRKVLPNYSVNRCIKILDKAIDAGWVTSEVYSEKYYKLYPKYHLYLLWMLFTQHKQKYTNWSEPNFWYVEDDYTNFLDRFQDALEDKKKFLYKEDDFEVNSIKYIIQEFRNYKETVTFYTSMDQMSIFMAAYANTVYDVCSLDMSQNYEQVCELYLNHPAINSQTKQILEDQTNLYKQVWTGDFPEDDFVSSYTANGIANWGVIRAYQDKTKESLANFETVLNALNKNSSQKLLFPINDYYTFVYVMVLCRENTPESEKLMKSMLRSVSIKDDTMLGIRLLLLERLGKMPDLIKLLQKDDFPTTRLGQFILYVVFQNLKLIEHAGVAAGMWKRYMDALSSQLFAFFVTHPENKLLFMEFAHAAGRKMDVSLPVKSLFSARMEVPEWDLLLKRMSISLAQITTSKTKGNEQSRIIYLYNGHNYISPRLQKSKDGIAWTKGRAVALSSMKKGCEGMDDVDRQVAMAISVYSGYYGKQDWELNVHKALTALIGTNRLFLEDRPEVMVDVRSEKPSVIVNKKAKGFSIEIWPKTLKTGTVVVTESYDRLVLTEISEMQYSILNSLQNAAVFPPEAEEELRKFLVLLSAHINVHSELLSKEFEKRQVTDKLTLQLLPLDEELVARLYAKPFVDCPPYCTPGEGIVEITGKNGNDTFVGKRNLKLEKQQKQKIEDALITFHDTEGENNFRVVGNEQALEFIDTLHGLADVVRVEWPQGVKYRIEKQLQFQDLSVKIARKNNWFEMSGTVQLGDDVKMELRDLLNKMDNSRFVSLGENEYLALSAKLHKQLKQLKAMADTAKKRVVLPTVSMLRLNKMQDEGVDIDGDKAYKEVREKMLSAQQQHYAVPSTLQASLRDYQAEGYEWMARLTQWGAGCCLADDMGLGKTVQTIALMLLRAKEGATLIIAPASVIRNWQRELTRFAPSLRLHILNDSDRESCIEGAGAGDVVITTYGLLTTEEERLSKKTWAAIVADEAHVVKNRNTKMSKSLMQLNGNTRVALTGTPLQNNLSEIWNLFEFINPGLLGSYNAFTERFIRPIEQNDDKERQQTLKRLLSPFILRRTKNEVLEELPTKTEIVHKVELTPIERKHYEILRSKAEHDAMEDGGGNKFTIMAQIARLRQAACDLRLIDTSLVDDGSKVEQLMKLVDELRENGHSALIFSQYTSMLELVQKRLKKEKMDYLYLDGSTPIKKREELVNRFQQGESQLFLISLKAGGVGLNLTQADYVIHLDPWWNPAVEDQATDRIYRIGQQRPVTVYRLISDGTIEEKILELHATKRNLADALLEGSNMNHKISADELLKLLKEE